MTRTLKIIITVFFIISFAGCSLFSRRYTKNISGESRVTATGKTSFKLDNTNGRIKIAHTDEPFIIIKYDASMKVKKNDMDDLSKNFTLRIDSMSSSVTVESEIPEEHGIMIFEHSVKINYEIFLPDGIDVSIDNVNGNLIFDKMTNNITVDLVNGNVDFIEDSGNSKVDITNGSFHGVVDSTRGMNIDITNGNIRLNTKKYFAGEVTANVMHGKFTHEGIEFTKVKNNSEKDNFGEKDFYGEIGTSGSKLRFNITNGNINITSLEKNITTIEKK
ncbi:hypothetical protein BH10BAC5_BH10BAC5_10010 [soil metagenome]